MKILQVWCHPVTATSPGDDARCVELNPLQRLEPISRQARKQRIVVVDLRQDDRGDELSSSGASEEFPDPGNATKMEVGRATRLDDLLPHGEILVKNNSKVPNG